MKEQFREKGFSEGSLILIGQSQSVVEEYQKMGIKITLRQLYYQLVARDIIPNQQRAYKRLGTLIADARYAGLIDWAAIEDRVRIPRLPTDFSGIPEIIRVAIAAYRLDRWEGQPCYVELFCEKDALSSVLAPIATEWHIPFSVNRGYASATAMYDTAKRIMNEIDYGDKRPIILYLGDHDPSGLDMIRDVGDRVKEFDYAGDSLLVEHLAITMNQIEEYTPPPNPTKITDSRAEKYIEAHGDSSWELDALPPDMLQKLVRDHILKWLDRDKYDEVLRMEEEDKNKLTEFAQKYKG